MNNEMQNVAKNPQQRLAMLLSDIELPSKQMSIYTLAASAFAMNNRDAWDIAVSMAKDLHEAEGRISGAHGLILGDSPNESECYYVLGMYAKRSFRSWILRRPSNPKSIEQLKNSLLEIATAKPRTFQSVVALKATTFNAGEAQIPEGQLVRVYAKGLGMRNETDIELWRGFIIAPGDELDGVEIQFTRGQIKRHVYENLEDHPNINDSVVMD